MKQEASKKNKKWLWLVIALVALLAVAGTVLALVLPGLHSEAEPEAVNAELYWNVDRLTYTQNAEVTGFSTREPAQDGKFYVRFAYEGQQLELQVVDKQLINFIDSMDVMGLIFDADGVVVDAVAPETIATKVASDFYVRQLKEGSVVLNSSIAMNGMDVELAITEAAGIWDVSPDAETVGQAGELNIFDRVQAFADEEGTVTHVYITSHAVDADIYWRVERCLDTETGLTTRVPDENGVYTIAFSHKGQLVDLKCKDVEVVNDIDLNGLLAGQFALVFDEEGYIVDTVDVGMALRGTLFASDYHVTGIDGSTISLTKLSAGSEQGNTKSVTLSADCQIWQCCQFGCYDHNCGEIIDSLQMYDRVNIYADLNGEAIMIFVTRRMVDTPMFYNFAPQYGGEAKGSTRAKQGGYYVFELLSDGKVVTVKTADKAIADAIDSRSNRCSGLVLEGNIITRVYDPSCVFGGVALGNRSPLTSMSGSVITISDPYSGGSWNAVLSADCKIYNAITGVYGQEPGGEMDLQVGDIVTTFRNYRDEIVLVFVTARPVQGAKVYYNLERQYNAELMQTRREPDASGYYVFLMACEGKQVTVKTRSKALATFIDSQNAPLVGLKVDKSGVVTNAYEVTIALQNATKTCNYHYVKNLNQKAGTFSTYYLEDGQKKDSSIAYQQMASNCVVYNVSNTYENYRGEVSKLKDGDQIQAIADVVSGEIVQIYIMNRDPIYGFESYKAACAHCGKTVTWQPYGGAVIVEEDIHYYACSDYMLRQGIIGKEDDDKVYDVVIDLKGRTVNGSGRAFLVYDKLTILDSVGGGKVAGLTPSSGTATSGSTVMVLSGGELNLMGGELTLSKKSTEYGSSGGVLFVGEKSVANMSGGSITGGISADRGGNVYNGGTFNMTGGTIKGGSSAVGDNILSMTGSVLNISGGTVDGGIQVLSNAKVTLSGKTVIGGNGLKLPAGGTISVAGLTKGASVVVDGDGIFTEELTDAASYLAYFKPASQNDRIEAAGSALNYIKKRANYNNVNNGNLSFAAGTTNAVCPVCEKTVSWTALTADAVTLSDGHYYLASDITYTGSEAAFITGPGTGKTACVHLNGHNITATAYNAVEGKAGVLNIMGNGTVSGSYNANRLYGATVNMNGADGILNLVGGTYTKSETCNVSSVLLIRNGDVNMYGGAQVVGVNDSGKCANVVVFNRSFNMYGGKISGGAGQQLQANNWSPTATAITNIYGGEIVGTVAISGADTKRGTFNMDGGTITSYVNLSRFVNTVITGGTLSGTVNIDINATNENSSVTVSGAPVITGSGLVIPEGYKLTVGQLTTGASIRVFATGIFTNELVDAEATRAYFTARGQSDEILVEGNALSYNLIPKDPNAINNDPLSFTTGTNAVCPVCDSGEVTWTALSAAATTLEGGKHYYLASDITYSGSDAPFITGPGAGMTACVHLNGHNITATANRAIEGKTGTLNIMGTGIVSGSFNDDRLLGATVNMNGADGYLNLFGGTYTKSQSCNISPILLIRGGEVNLCGGAQVVGVEDSGNCPNVVVFNRSFNMYGGKISGGAGQQLQANNWSPTATAITNIYGGEIVGTVAISGADTKHGAFNMYGGTITGYVNLNRFVDSVITGGTVAGTVNIDTPATNGNSSVMLFDAPVITGGGLVIPEGYRIIVGELTTGADIQVYASGVFTDLLTDADATRGYFTPVGADDKIEIVDNALSYIKTAKDLNTVNNDPLSFTTGTNAVCPTCGGREVAWTALTANATTLEGGKHYYLASDITYAGSETAFLTGPGTGMTACVHLNGHNITATANSAIEGKAGTLNIMGNGTVSGSYNANRLFGATVNMNGAEGVLNLIGGIFTKSEACNVSSVLLIRNGDVNMYNGAQVVGANDSGSCVNVAVFNRSFNMYGGKISGGAGQQLQANNWSPTATAITNIHGGEIVGTVAISGADTKHGIFNMDGGTITGYVNLNRFVDSVITGGTVDGTVNIDTPATNSNSSVTLSDAPVITGSGLVIPEGYKITLGQLTEDADIMVRASGVFTDMLEDAQTAMESFTPAEGYELLQQEGALLCRKKQIDPSDYNAMILNGQKITASAKAMTFPTGKTESTQVCPVCDKTVTWKPLSGQLGGVSDGAHHHYYLTNQIYSQYQFITLTSGSVCLHMNGYNVDVESRMFVTGGDINIMGTGTITGLGTSGTQTGTLTVGSNTTASLYGCTIASTAQSGTPAIRLVNGDTAKVNVYDGTTIGGEKGTCHGANVVLEKGSFSMYGGTVQNGAGYQYGGMLRGGNIFLSAGTSVEMYAGTVTGGTANQGGNIFATGASLNIYKDAVISGGESTGEGGNVQMIESSTLTTAGKITKGKTTGEAAHGGNISMTSGCALVIGGGEITEGTAAGQGGNVRAWNATITMTDGQISDGDSVTTANDNVWAAGSTVMTMLGGIVKGTDGATANGTAINVSQTAVLYLGGDAVVIRDDGINVGNIYIYASAAETAVLRVLNDWTGTAGVKWTKAYAVGDTVDADRGSCGTLTEGVFTKGGTYTGTLVYEQSQASTVNGEDGVLKIAAAE